MEERPTQQPWEDATKISLSDIILVLEKRKGLIIGVTMAAAVLMAVWSLALPSIYLAETKILTPQTGSSMASQLLSQLGNPSPLLDAMPSGKATAELYVELMKSRTVLERIVERFGLMAIYKIDTREGARKSLEGKIKIRSNAKSGILTVGVEDTDPKRASAIANALVEELRAMNKGLSVTEASQRRLFFEEQLKDAGDKLARAEEAMKTFQEKSGAVKIDAQADAVIQGISSLRAQIAAKEVQIRVMRTYSTERNRDLIMAKEELKGMLDQVSRLETKGVTGNGMVPTGNIPAASTEYLRRVRDLKFSETLYELLLGQYQVAKLDEARDVAVIQVIEKAVPPEFRVRPKRRDMVTAATLAGLLLALLAAFILEYKEGMAQSKPESSEKIVDLRRSQTLR